MMMNKRLIAMVGESKKYIAGNVIFQWLGMLANILMMYSITGFLGTLLPDSGRGGDFYQNIKRLVKVASPAAVRQGRRLLPEHQKTGLGCCILYPGTFPLHPSFQPHEFSFGKDRKKDPATKDL